MLHLCFSIRHVQKGTVSGLWLWRGCLALFEETLSESLAQARDDGKKNLCKDASHLFDLLQVRNRRLDGNIDGVHDDWQSLFLEVVNDEALGLGELFTALDPVTGDG